MTGLRQCPTFPLMLITVVHNHEARKRSYELMAKAFEIPSP